jgi:hypothetical protein
MFSFLKGKKSDAKLPLPPSPISSSLPAAQPVQQASSQQTLPDLKFPSASDLSAPKESKDNSQSFAVYNVEEPKKDDFSSLGSSMPQKQESSGKRQIDDFGIPVNEDLELPEINLPKFKFPTVDEKDEIKKAIMNVEEQENFSKPAPRPAPRREAPKKDFRKKEQKAFEELPEIGETSREASKEEAFPENVDEPVVLRELPKASKNAVFISAERLSHVKKGLSSMKDNAKNMEDMILNINEIKNKQDADLELWHASIETIQRKLVYIDRTLFEKR